MVTAEWSNLVQGYGKPPSTTCYPAPTKKYVEVEKDKDVCVYLHAGHGYVHFFLTATEGCASS